MSVSARSRLVASIVSVLIAGGIGPSTKVCARDDGAARSELPDTFSDDDGFGTPSDDPWYQAPQAQPGSRPRPGEGLVFKMRITPHWFEHDTRFWYRNDLATGAREFIVVDAEKGTRGPAFDHSRLATALSKAAGSVYRAYWLPFDEMTFVDGQKAVQFAVNNTSWKCDLASYECSKTQAAPSAAAAPAGDAASAQQERARRRDGEESENRSSGGRSPDGKWTAFVQDHNVFIRREGEKEPIRLSADGKAGMAYGNLSSAPDSKTLAAFRTEPGDNKEVYLIRSSPPEGGRAQLQKRPYPLPGDKFPAHELNLFDIANRKQTKPAVDRIDFGMPRLRWTKDGSHFTYEKTDRGHQRFRLIEVDAHSGAARNIIDEQSRTFIWTAHRENIGLRTVTWLDKTGEIIYVSERDGWRHLYLIDAKTGQTKNRITQGQYVVRGVDQVDEDKRQVWFRASGKILGQDPYFIQYFRVGFDGAGLVALTEREGSHTVQYSPDRRYLIDTFSKVDMPPHHELRKASDGSLVCKLEEADITRLEATGWRPPEVFVAKGRDGSTDIWGVIARPKNFDPNRKYPVIEEIYAGPQGSFVPKTFSPPSRYASLADLGFIVVQMDGMGTANRSKAFHDVCWHNLKDAGFPDRILWHQAVARKYPYYDISRVGIHGTSAGGQNSTGGVLFHPEFYKVAVSACGCHDNRMDKASWNEQWMGYPVGPWYSESSNIDNAKRLQGKLLLIVGEMDTNVPPESTMRLVDALIKAGKDFELLVVPGAGHGMGGAYGQKRMRDFFVRHLIDAAPAESSSVASSRGTGSSTGPVVATSPARSINDSHSSAPASVMATSLVSRNDSRSPAVGSSAAATNRSQPAGGKARSGSASPDGAPTFDMADLNNDRSELRGVILRFMADRATQQGTLPQGSRERDERGHEFNAQWLDRLAKLDFDYLSQDGKVDYLLLKNYLTHQERQHEIRVRERKESERLIPFARTIADLEAARRELKPMEWSKVADTISALTKTVDEARRSLEREGRGRGNIPRLVANRALADVESLRGNLREWFGFYDGYDPLFTWWLQEPYKVADEALQSYASFMQQRLGAVTTGMSDGGGGFRRGGGGGFGGGGFGGGGGGFGGGAGGFGGGGGGGRGGAGGGGGGFGGGPGGGGGAGRAGGGPGGAGGAGGAATAGGGGGRAGNAAPGAVGRGAAAQAGGDGQPARPQSGSDRDIVGNPIGREALMSELEYEMIAYTPEELLELAATEMKWCENEMKKASREMGFGDDWHKALEKVKTQHVEPGKQPALIRDLAFEAIEYLERNNLITIPPLARDAWRMAMMSPEAQLTSPFFLGGESIIVSFPTASMSHEAKLMSMRGNNIHFCRATVFHELIPGHNLQQFMTSRYKTYRRIFSTPFWTEGWALYWELLLWDRGFAKSPENRIGMLFWHMHRCARITFSLSFHLEKMNPQQCIDLLVNQVGHERDNATAEVRRSFAGSYGPLYQAAYLLGGLQLRSLHREMVETGKMSDRDFHDTILKENGVPIDMVRALVSGRKLTANYKPDWKFYGPIAVKTEPPKEKTGPIAAKTAAGAPKIEVGAAKNPAGSKTDGGTANKGAGAAGGGQSPQKGGTPSGAASANPADLKGAAHANAFKSQRVGRD
jgi:dipeptidyl aminopeptidase/acylaminoacyl peptidase/uncharacterized protein (DUF885 family)